MDGWRWVARSIVKEAKEEMPQRYMLKKLLEILHLLAMMMAKFRPQG